MPKREGRFIKALRERQEEARLSRLRREAEEQAASEAADEAPRPSERRVLQERAAPLWPAKKHRPYWR